MDTQEFQSLICETGNATDVVMRDLGGRLSATGGSGPAVNVSESDPAWLYLNALTEKQVEVLSLLAEGLSNKQIAHRLGIALGTIKTHVSQILRRLNVERRGEAMLIAQRIESIRVHQDAHARNGAGLLGILLPHAMHARFRCGEILFRRGERATELFYVKRGVVAMPEVSARVSDGELLGEVGIFSRDGRRTATARCDTDVEAFVLPGAKARELYYLNAHFAMHVTTTMAQRFCNERTQS